MPSILRLVPLWAAAMALGLFGCSPSVSDDRLVVQFSLDGASPDILQELLSERKLPTFHRLIRSGTFGPLRSLAARRIMRARLQRGYWSPILWTSIATGKVPEKHGVRDFLLPQPETTRVWMGSEADPATAQLSLPEIGGEAPFTLELRLRSHPDVGEQAVIVLFNDAEVGTVRVPVHWDDFKLELPPSSLRPFRNQVTLVFSRQSRPADQDPGLDRRRLAAELSALSVVDAGGETVVAVDPVSERYQLGRGFYLPQAEKTVVQSEHWRALPVWSLLGARGLPVGVVGHWGTWPAYEVNGFLVSSHMGVPGERSKGTRLTWPPQLAEAVIPLVPTRAEMSELTRALGLDDCSEPLLTEDDPIYRVLEQDELYYRIAREQWPGQKRGYLSVYFESIDVMSHNYLHWRHGAAIPEGCSESVRGIVEATYERVDRWMKDLLETLPRDATILVVSDHGMMPGDDNGFHARDGVVIASGKGIRRGARIQGTSVLDVAPTVLYLSGSPIPLDMDGKLLPQIFEAEWLDAHPPRYVDIDTSRQPSGEAMETNEELLDRLRSLGYVQ